jgi:hypothetical protein
LKDKPFALIGVNIAGSAAPKLKAVMKKENLTWRSFTDPGEIGRGAIASKWNIATTPTLYILDADGIIRSKWRGSPGEKAIDDILNELIQEAER